MKPIYLAAFLLAACAARPNPAKDDQLRRALELVKAPQQWRAALGQAATRPAKPIEH